MFGTETKPRLFSVRTNKEKTDTKMVEVAKKDGNYQEIGSGDFLEGRLISITSEFREVKIQGQPKKDWAVDFTLQSDEGWTARLSFLKGNQLRSVVNSLASAGELGRLTFKVWHSDKYGRVSVSNNGQLLGWKFPRKPSDPKKMEAYEKAIAEGATPLPDAPKVETPTGKVNDYRAQDRFLFDELAKIIASFNATVPGEMPQEIKSAEPAMETPPQKPIVDFSNRSGSLEVEDDLPF